MGDGVIVTLSTSSSQQSSGILVYSPICQDTLTTRLLRHRHSLWWFNWSQESSSLYKTNGMVFVGVTSFEDYHQLVEYVMVYYSLGEFCAHCPSFQHWKATLLKEAYIVLLTVARLVEWHVLLLPQVGRRKDPSLDTLHTCMVVQSVSGWNQELSSLAPTSTIHSNSLHTCMTKNLHTKCFTH